MHASEFYGVVAFFIWLVLYCAVEVIYILLFASTSVLVEWFVVLTWVCILFMMTFWTLMLALLSDVALAVVWRFRSYARALIAFNRIISFYNLAWAALFTRYLCVSLRCGSSTVLSVQSSISTFSRFRLRCVGSQRLSTLLTFVTVFAIGAEGKDALAICYYDLDDVVVDVTVVTDFATIILLLSLLAANTFFT